MWFMCGTLCCSAHVCKMHTISAKIALKFMHARGSMACMVGVYSSLYYATVTVHVHVCKN